MNIVFEIHWTAPETVRDPLGGAWGRGRLLVAGTPIWGRDEGIEWRWADLLEHLTEIWPWLVWEQSYPIDVRPLDMAGLRAEAERRWERLALDEVEAEDSLLHAWERRHYLNQGLGSLYVAGIGLLREGRSAQVTADGQVWRWPLAQVLADLERMGDVIAAQVASSPRPECQTLVARWRARLETTPQRRAAIEAAVPVKALGAELSEAALGAAPLEEVPLLVAARMTRGSRVSENEWRQILGILREVAPAPIAPELQSLSRAAQALLPNLADLRWFEQGSALAEWLRDQLGRSGQFQPERQLEKWKVPIHDVAFASSLDALALWSEDTAVLVVNTQGTHARSKAGRRATLAHEIAHLLVDRQSALPTVEVLGGQVPWHVERRANAFAAELLAPRAEVAEAVESARVPGAALLERLRNRYAVSRELIAWQVRNSGVFDRLSVEDQRPFRQAVRCWGL